MLIAIDQFSKMFVSTYFPEMVSLNYGAAFGLAVPWYISFVVGILVLFGIWYLKNKGELKFNLFVQLFVAGTIGNMIDRIWHSYVIDFIDFKVWPSFNLADAYLTVAVLYFVFQSLTNPHENKKITN